MQKMGRERRSESAWADLVSRQNQSGLTVRAFSEREGINAASLYGWRSKLRDATGDSHVAERLPKKVRREQPAADFIDVGALGASRSRFEVRLDLGAGVLLHLVRS